MKELPARTQLAEAVAEKPFIRGSLIKRKLTCGNPACKCFKGKPHPAFYLGVRFKNKRQIIQVPAGWVQAIEQWIKNYRHIAGLIEIVSESCITKLMKGKAKATLEG